MVSRFYFKQSFLSIIFDYYYLFLIGKWSLILIIKLGLVCLKNIIIRSFKVFITTFIKCNEFIQAIYFNIGPKLKYVSKYLFYYQFYKKFKLYETYVGSNMRE